MGVPVSAARSRPSCIAPHLRPPSPPPPISKGGLNLPNFNIKWMLHPTCGRDSYQLRVSYVSKLQHQTDVPHSTGDITYFSFERNLKAKHQKAEPKGIPYFAPMGNYRLSDTFRSLDALLG
jgi:hypothetical protein